VVTALEMTLYSVPELYGGALFFPIERSSEVLRAWRRWADTVPDELTSLGRLLRLPQVDDVPEPMRGREFVVIEGAYLGDALSGAALIRPLRGLGSELDTFAAIQAPALQQLHMDPESPVPGTGDGAFLAALPDNAIDTLLALVGPGAQTPLQSVEIRHLGGALAREARGAGALPKIDAQYVLFGVGIAPTPELSEAARTHARALKESLARWHAGYDYYNFVETPAEAEVVLPPASYQRLREIKATYDPDETIISAHPVRPPRVAR
jgi:hypothetical protein